MLFATKNSYLRNGTIQSLIGTDLRLSSLEVRGELPVVVLSLQLSQEPRLQSLSAEAAYLY